MPSQLLDRIHDHQNRTVNAKVVFADIVSYSKRRSQTQAEVVDGFMTCLRQALDETASNYISYIQSNGLNFENDVIRIPAGDGAAIIFPFEGLHDVHLHFALSLLNKVEEFDGHECCQKFEEENWCNCHANFKVTLGIAEGKVVLYKDINAKYNVAGNAINMAARVMGLAKENQIIFTEDAYRQIVDLINDAKLYEKFLEFKNVSIKHGIEITVYQYIDDTVRFLNSTPSETLTTMKRMDAAGEKMKSLGMALPPLTGGGIETGLELVEGMAKLLEGVAKMGRKSAVKAIDVSTTKATGTAGKGKPRKKRN